MGAAAMYALVACIAFLCTVNAKVTPLRVKSAQVPNGKVYVYNYSAAISTGQNEPAPFASKLEIKGKLIHQHDNSVSNLNAVYMKYENISFKIYNGEVNQEVHSEYQRLNDTILMDFEKPILVLTDEFNKLQGIKIQREAPWSENMKKSLASIMQIEFIRFEMQETMQPAAFQTAEKTIHGECLVDYNIYTKEVAGRKSYYVRKVFEPKKCSKYVQFTIKDQNKSKTCSMEDEEDLITSVERIYEFNYINNDFIVRKIIAREKISYLPWPINKYGVQHVETSQTFELEKVVDKSELRLPIVDFNSIPITSDVTFDNYLQDSSSISENPFGRHVIKSKKLIAKIQEYLISLVNYLKENHMDVKEIHPEYKSRLEKLRNTMIYLDSDTLHYIFKHFNKDSEKGKLTRQIFLEMIPHAGTHAVWKFVQNLITEEDISEEIATNLLNTLPIYISNPTEDFAKQMIGFSRFTERVPKAVIKAGILCYSILLHKVYKDIGHNMESVPEFLKEQLTSFNEHVQNEPTYLLKIVYIMAIRNVEVGGIYKYLAPLVRGENVFSVNADISKPEKYRVAAMWAVAKSINHDKDLTYDLFWPILSNNTNSLSLRVAAYELLVPRNPLLDMNMLMNVHWLMMEEKDEHLFNYHYTTLKYMSKLTNPCTNVNTEAMSKILRLTKQRNILKSLSTTIAYDYFDPTDGTGRIIKLGLQMDEILKIPHAGYYEEISNFGRKLSFNEGIFWHIDGMNVKGIKKLINSLMKKNFYSEDDAILISEGNFREVLLKTRAYRLLDKDVHVEFWVTDNGYVTDVVVLFENGLFDLVRESTKTSKAKTLMESDDDFNSDFFCVPFIKYYQTIVGTDMGIPVFFYYESPHMLYMKLKPYAKIADGNMALKLEFEARNFYHHSFAIKFFNPFGDMVHSAQRSIVADAVFPIDVTISYNLEAQSLKLIFPRMPDMKYSVTGIKVYSVDQVRIENDDKNLLKNHCPNCKHLADIRNRPADNKNYKEIVTPIYSGLDLTHAVFNCDSHALPNGEYEESLRVLNMHDHNAYDHEILRWYMMFSHRLNNYIHTPYTGSCGKILKLTPSKLHPISHIEMNWRFNVDNSNNNFILKVYGSIDSKRVSNETVSYWNVFLNSNFTKFSKKIDISLTRKTSGEKDLKVCLGVQKFYPNSEIGKAVMKYETKTLISFTMDHSDEQEQCTFDETIIKVSVKGKLSDEQIKQIKLGNSEIYVENPLINSNYLDNLVKATTLRMYTIDIEYKKLPHEFFSYLIDFDDYLRYTNAPYITYIPDQTEEGYFKVSVNVSTSNHYSNIVVVNPYYSYKLTNVPFYKSDKNSLHLLDNIKFPLNFLRMYYADNTGSCIVHANFTINDLNQTMPMVLNDWTLMYGEIGNIVTAYAIFAKSVQDKVAFKIYNNLNILEIQPGDAEPVITYDGSVIDNHSLSSLPSASFRLYFANNLLTVEETNDFIIYYTPKAAVVIVQNLPGIPIDGTCGHLGSRVFTQDVPLIYNSS